MDSPNTTPAKRSAAAMRVPTKKKTGNQVADDEADMQRQLLQDLIDDLIAHPQHIVAVHTAHAKHKHQGSATQTEGMMQSVSVLSRLPQDFMMGFITSHSDLHGGDIVGCMRHDNDSLIHIFQLAL